jgi:hypothetical protein
MIFDERTRKDLSQVDDSREDFILLLAAQALLARKNLGMSMEEMSISFAQWQRIVHTFDDTLRLPDEHVPFDPLCRDHDS